MPGIHDSGQAGNQDASLARTILPSLIVLVAVVGVGYLTMDRLSSVEERLEEFDERVGEVSERVNRAVEMAAEARGAAGTALDRAAGAEENAAEAARERDAAEAEQRVAEEARLRAERVMAEAQEIARLAVEEADLTREELDRLNEERQAELDRLEEALGAIVETRRTALGLVMNLGSDAIEFPFDSAALGGEDRELLSRIAGILLTSSGFSVGVYGHTDDVGTAEYNQALSERRAESVRDYLVEAGVDPEIISTVGYGQSSPRVEGTTPDARAKNRRVEVAIIDVNLGPARTAP